jgi:hypothetical protein
MGERPEVPGGIEVTFEKSPGATRTVEVVVTAAEWDDYISTIYGTGDPRATTLKKQVLATPAGTPYLVYDNYDWEPSETRELPEDGRPQPATTHVKVASATVSPQRRGHRQGVG